MLGNYLDLAIIFYVLVYAIPTHRKNLPDLLSNLLSLLVALPLAFASYGWSAGFFQGNFDVASGYAKVLGFFLNLFVFRLVLVLSLDRFLAKRYRRIVAPTAGRKKLRSTLLAMLNALMIVFILFSAASALSLPEFFDAQLQKSRFGRLVKSDPGRLNDDFRGVFGELLPAALRDFSFLSVQNGPTERKDLPAKVLVTQIDSQAEEKMLELVNQERTSRGIKPLVMDEEARRAARDYGQYLFKNGVFDHTDLEGRSPSDRLKTYNIEFMMAGENLAFAPDLEKAHTGLMNSQGHKENILRPFFGRVGIGVVDGGEDYGMIFVQEFLD